MTDLAEALTILADGRLHTMSPLVEVAVASGFAEAVCLPAFAFTRRPARLARITESGLRERARRVR